MSICCMRYTEPLLLCGKSSTEKTPACEIRNCGEFHFCTNNLCDVSDTTGRETAAPTRLLQICVAV